MFYFWEMTVYYFVDVLSADVSASPYASSLGYQGWSGGAMVLGKLPVPGRPTIWIQ